MGNLSLVTIIIIAANVIISYKGFSDYGFFERYKFNVGGVRRGEQIRMFSSGFLHADTILPTDAVNLILSLQEDYFWGFFNLRLSSQKSIFRLIEWMINRRSRWSSIATGDQSIFIERKSLISIFL